MLKGFMALSLFAQGLLEKLQSLKPTITKTSVEVPSKKIIIKKATLDQVPEVIKLIADNINNDYSNLSKLLNHISQLTIRLEQLGDARYNKQVEALNAKILTRMATLTSQADFDFSQLTPEDLEQELQKLIDESKSIVKETLEFEAFITKNKNKASGLFDAIKKLDSEQIVPANQKKFLKGLNNTFKLEKSK